MITCTVFNPCLDVTYSLDEFQSGTTYKDVVSQQVPAGKGINVARAVRTLGEDVCIVALLPEENYQRFGHYFDTMGIKARLFSFPGNVRVNATVCESSNAKVSHISSAGSEVPYAVQADFLKFIKRRIRKNDRWALCGSLPAAHDPDTYQTVIAMLRKRGAFSLLDARGEALRRGIRARPDVIKPNFDEFQEYFGEEIKGIRHIALKGKRFGDRGIRYAFISLGADGMIAIHGNDCLLCSVPPISPVDTVGCGDAVVAGILVGMQRNLSFDEICRLAVACGVSNALHTGAGVIRIDDIERLKKDIYIESV
ncbi:MAG: hexose kinase [Chitinivibrionales bacterium]|nr:hexose kinase [Chitinivibrionales bacterium]